MRGQRTVTGSEDGGRDALLGGVGRADEPRNPRVNGDEISGGERAVPRRLRHVGLSAGDDPMLPAAELIECGEFHTLHGAVRRADGK